MSLMSAILGCRQYLNVPYKDRERVRNAGGKWDRNERSWYIGDEYGEGEEEEFLSRFERWIPKNEPIKEPVTHDYVILELKFRPDVVNRVKLNVSFADKEAAKYQGAKWDPIKKEWYTTDDYINYKDAFKKWL